MRKDTFAYDVDPSLIADTPPATRDGARLMVVRGHTLAHAEMRALPELLPTGAVVVVNDTKVLPARLLGKKLDTGGAVEIFLLRKHADGSWNAMGRSSKPLRPGVRISVPPLEIEVLEKNADGTLRVRSNAGEQEESILSEIGHIPLPPYIRRHDTSADRERYQTVFAKHNGSVAAPTAGLHLTHGMLEGFRARGIEVHPLTLHVGLGTFQPVTADDLDDHPMHSEVFSVPETTQLALAKAKHESRPVVAIGTTVVRALESAAQMRTLAGETRLLIQPGYVFQCVDMLLTNFHLPESTLLSLVCAFGGTPSILSAYRCATEMRYRFFSYGDAMLVTRT